MGIENSARVFGADGTPLYFLKYVLSRMPFSLIKIYDPSNYK